jgi:hypothetical protein
VYLHRRIYVERPVYVERRVVVHRPVYAERPARVYGHGPVVYGPPSAPCPPRYRARWAG